MAEGVESTAAEASTVHQQKQQEQAQQQSSLAKGWDVEQGGVVTAGAAAGSMQHPYAQPTQAPAPPVCSHSQRWVQSRGNIWLLQALADALGISRDAAAGADTGAGAVEAPLGSEAVTSTAAASRAGGKAGLSSAAGGLWSDEGVCGCLCGGKWGTSHVPKMAPLTASQRLTNEAIMQVWLGLCCAAPYTAHDAGLHMQPAGCVSAITMASPSGFHVLSVVCLLPLSYLFLSHPCYICLDLPTPSFPPTSDCQYPCSRPAVCQLQQPG